MDKVKKRAINNFLEYAGAVIKARAISDVNDNLKPVHKRILWTMWNRKVYDTTKTQKCATIAGAVLAYHPHGDGAVYGALVRLAQSWVMRYPLIDFEGNVGNILGASAAASRYTNCKLSKIGMWMLDGIDKNAVKMVDNYDSTLKEPTILPSMFPNILCNGSLGIAVGISASLMPFNYTEVANLIRSYLNNPDISTDEILKIMPGPDFPTGGFIINREDLKNIYETGNGNLKVRAHYYISKENGHDDIVFTDLPYGVEIEDGIMKPLKKMVLEEGIDLFYDVINNTSSNDKVEIHILLNKGVSIQQGLAALFEKTKLQQTVRVNNMVLVNGEPRLLSIKSMVSEWIKHRNTCITNIAQTDLEKANHRLTIIIGLEKCVSDIDNVIKIIRGASDRNSAKNTLMAHYELNEEQVNAVLDMKLSRLSLLDIQDLKNDCDKTTKEIEKQKDIINNEKTRSAIIISQLNEMQKYCGDPRRTEIGSANIEDKTKDIPLHDYFGYPSEISDLIPPTSAVVGREFAKNKDNLFIYNAEGTLYPAGSTYTDGIGIGNLNKKELITITMEGYIKKTAVSDIFNDKYKTTKILKLKEEDHLLMAQTADDSDFAIALGEDGSLTKIAISSLNSASKLTLGNKLGIGKVIEAVIAKDSDLLCLIDSENRGKLISVQDIAVNTRTSKGQKINDNNRILLNATNCEYIYLICKGKISSISVEKKMSLKSKTASGAVITTHKIDKAF